MKSQPEFTADLNGFHGSAPIFPLPNVVQFPCTALPLRVFEERYRALVADALSAERWIAMALLKPGWEADYFGRPEIHEMVCLGRISADEQLASGEYQIVVTGVHRAVVIEEERHDAPYRIGQLELYRDFYPSHPAVSEDQRQRDLIVSFRRLFPASRADSLFAQVLDAGLPLGVTCDLLASALRLPPAECQTLLEELDVEVRSRLVLEKIHERLDAMSPGLSTGAAPARSFPPTFSLN